MNLCYKCNIVYTSLKKCPLCQAKKEILKFRNRKLLKRVYGKSEQTPEELEKLKEFEEPKEPEKPKEFTKSQIYNARNILKKRKERGILCENQIIALEVHSHLHYKSLSEGQKEQIMNLLKETKPHYTMSEEKRAYYRDYKHNR